MKMKNILVPLMVLFFCFSLGACGKATSETEKGSLDTAEVIRGDNGQLSLTWSGVDADTIDVFWSTIPDAKASRTLLIEDAKNGSITFDDPSPTARPYFILQTATGVQKIIAERHLPLNGVMNARDIGGYKNIDGKTVKWGIFFRSAELNKMTDDSQAYLQNSGFKLDIDYRSDQEVTSDPDPVISGINYKRLNCTSAKGVSGNPLQPYIDNQVGAPGEFLTQLNKDLVKQDTGVYKQLLETLLDENNYPLITHCAGGKDRTGLGAAIVLLALDVPKDVIMQDYLLSNAYLAKYGEAILNEAKSQLNDEQLKVLAAVLGVKAEYLQAAFDEMELEYGSTNAYLEKGLGLTPEKKEQLKKLMLE